MNAGVKGVERWKVMDMFVSLFGEVKNEKMGIEEDENAGELEKNGDGSKCSAWWEREDDNLKMVFEREAEVSVWKR